MKRRLLQSLLTGVSCALCVISVSVYGTATRASGDERAISLYHIHTQETLSIVYKRDGQFVPEALEQFNHFMRDWRRNATIKMDPNLLDLIWEMHKELGSQKPVYVVCGYRSPATNEMLRRTRGGQAKRSRHITGQAVDLYFPDVDLKQLRSSALVRERGGVGYYPTSAVPFVHVDTGPVRMWPRMPRQELALLFPSGKSQYTPADGRPITKADFRMALASVEQRGGTLPIAVQRLLNKPAAPTPMLASLGPSSSSVLGGERQTSAGPANPPAAMPLPNVTMEPAVPQTPVAVTPEQGVSPQGTAAQPQFGQGFVTAALPKAERDLGEDQIARTPDYDDDHPDEASYQPFPILPLMTESPLAYADFSSDGQNVARKMQYLLAGSNGSVSVSFQHAPQYEGMYWAQRFTGKAIGSAITKFVATEPPGSTAMKTAQEGSGVAAKSSP